jgi:hypothetical protein
MKIYKLKKDEHTETYSDSIKDEWEIYECICGCKSFRVISTGAYETSIKCIECGFMDIAHDG